MPNVEVSWNFCLIIFGACKTTSHIFQPIMVFRVHHPLHSIWSNNVPCCLQEGDWSPPMFFSSHRLIGVCFYLCLFASMLYRTCCKLQKHKLVCEIHGKNLTDVPFGVLLFGGLDSSLVDIVASWHLNDIEVANVWGAQFHIFSISLKVMIDLD